MHLYYLAPHPTLLDQSCSWKNSDDSCSNSRTPSCFILVFFSPSLASFSRHRTSSFEKAFNMIMNLILLWALLNLPGEYLHVFLLNCPREILRESRKMGEDRRSKVPDCKPRTDSFSTSHQVSSWSLCLRVIAWMLLEAWTLKPDPRVSKEDRAWLGLWRTGLMLGLCEWSGVRVENRGPANGHRISGV